MTPETSPLNILLIKQTSLGDVVHGTAAIRSVRLARPDARLTVLTSTTAVSVLTDNPDIDELLTFDRYRVKSDWWRHPMWCASHILSTVREVRKNKFDLAIDLQGSWKTVVFLWAAKTRKRFVKGRWLFARRFRKPHLHAIDEMGGVLQLAGITPRQQVPVLHVSRKSHERLDELLRETGAHAQRLAVLCPMTRWPTKNWPLDRFQTLAKRLQDRFYVVIAGASEDREVLEAMSRDLSVDRVLNLAGRLSLNEFFALIQRAGLVISGDSLPMHVASSFDTPLVGLFGPTDEGRVAPRSGRSMTLRADNQCRRCYRRSHCVKNCIADIRVEDVEKAIASVLKA